MNRSCSRKLSRSSTSVKLPKADKTIELIKDIISNVSPLKISNIIRETIEPQNEVEQGPESVVGCKRRGRKPKLSKKETREEAHEEEKRKPDENEIPKCESSKRKIKLIKREAELLCIPREEFEKGASIKRTHDAIFQRKKYSTTSNESSFQCSPIKEPSISGFTVLISDDEEGDYEKEPAKKVKSCDVFTTDSKEQVSFDMQKEFGNTLSELGERLKNLTTLGNSMKTLSFLQQNCVPKESPQQQHEPLEILNDFYSKVKKLYVEFGENLNQSK